MTSDIIGSMDKGTVGMVRVKSGNSVNGEFMPIPPRKGSMAPPPLPVSTSPAPRMTRLPSLQQISDRLHLPSPLATQSPSSSNIEPPSESVGASPKLKVAINPGQAIAPGLTSPFAASPSGRLKLPASAMMRSHSASSTTGIIDRLDKGKKGENDVLFNTTEPFASPTSPIGGGGGSQSMSRGTSREGYIKGYKDVPSLSAIRARMGSIKSLVPDIPKLDEEVESVKLEDQLKPETKTVEVPLPQEVPSKPHDPSPSASSSASSEESIRLGGKKAEHSLKHAWTLFFDSKGFKPDPRYVQTREGETMGDWEKSLVTVGKFETVEGFARHLNNVRLPSNLARNSNYHLFKNGIRPMWEDPANANGGKWVILFRSAPHLLDIAWANLTMAMIGDILDPEDKVCGIVASSRPKVDRIQVWTRSKDDVEAVNLIGRKILESMALEGRESENMSMEFQYNAGVANPPSGLFLHIPFTNRSASFAHAPPTPSRLTIPSPSLGSERHGLVHHPSLPQLPKSPVSPRSPLSPLSARPDSKDSLAPPSALSTPRRGSASSAFMGPMAGFVSSSSRRDSAQLGEAK